MPKLSQVGISKFHLDLSLDSGVIFSIYSTISYKDVLWSPNSATTMPFSLFNALGELLEQEVTILEAGEPSIALRILHKGAPQFSVLNEDGYESYFRRTPPE